MIWRANKIRIAILCLVVLGGVIFSLFNHWEICHETWGYWFFARTLAETGRFVIPDRSPLYTVYLNGFRWLGYPNSVTVEYLVTSIIMVSAVVALFKRYLASGISVLAAVLWIPFLQIAEPPVQKLALACSCWAMVARRVENNRFKFTVSYALLGLAYMFRHSYIILILLFATWDIYKHARVKGMKIFFSFRPRVSDWPIGIVLVLLILFVTKQSPHPWNNAWFASTTWFPSKGKTIQEAAIQSLNIAYIEAQYGTYEGRDFYFTNQEFYGGARDTLGGICAKPRFFINQIGRKVEKLISLMASTTSLPRDAKAIPGSLALLAVVAILYGAFQASRDEAMILFVIGNLFLIGTTVLLPKIIYMPPFIPVLILSASWYGTQARNILITKSRTLKWLFWSGLIAVGLFSLYLIMRTAFGPPDPIALSVGVIGYITIFVFVIVGGYIARDRAKRSVSSLGRMAVPMALILFSLGSTHWLKLVRNTTNDIRRGEIRVMENRPYSMKASFKALEPLIRNCKGVMSLEFLFIDAFMNVPLDRIYDIFEIPPFGHLGDPVYDGLRPDRVDCILVSHELATAVGAATNIEMRYKNYIKPYVEQLQNMGATTYEIPQFGQAIILQSPNY